MITHLENKKGNFSTTAVDCPSVLSQIKGLMFTPPLKKNHSILMKFRKEKNISIHMLFVFYPLDVIWLDKNYEIVHIARNMKPFISYVNPKIPAVAVLETLANATKDLRIGDKLMSNRN